MFRDDKMLLYAEGKGKYKSGTINKIVGNVRGKVPDEQLRRVTGHRSEAMTDRYDHARAEALGDVLAVPEQLFSFKDVAAAQAAPVASFTAEPAKTKSYRPSFSSEGA